MKYKINSRVTVLLFVAFLLIVVMRAYKSYEKNTDVTENSGQQIKVLLYVKEGCKYCILAKKLLQENNIKFEAIEISNDPLLRQKLVNKTGQTTVPYVFIDDKFVGGYQDLLTLKHEGKL